MTTISIRIDEDLKRKANKVFAIMGLDMTSAIKLFLHQTILENGLPFHPSNNPKFNKSNRGQKNCQYCKKI